MIPDSLSILIKPDYDCVVEVFEHPTAFPMSVSFAGVPSKDVSDFLNNFDANHPGVHCLTTQSMEVQNQMFERAGIAHRADQTSLYQYNVMNVYQCKPFGMAFANHLQKHFGLSVRFVHWPGGNDQFEKIYSPVNL